jgi:hypothetical protein
MPIMSRTFNAAHVSRKGLWRRTHFEDAAGISAQGPQHRVALIHPQSALPHICNKKFTAKQ